MAHTVHLALWDVDPSPVVCGEALAVKVGAKCACGCNLAGRLVSIRDGSGVELSSAALRPEPLQGTAGLFWVEVKIPAPGRIGTHAWSVGLAADAGLAHHEALTKLAFAVEHPPEHLVSVSVLERQTLNPVGGAEVRLGAFRAVTDAIGLAQVIVPTGIFDLSAWKPGYDSPTDRLEIAAKGAITLLVSEVPPDDSDERWC